jgi:Spy/CpxP family protein refolding chaperone
MKKTFSFFAAVTVVSIVWIYGNAQPVMPPDDETASKETVQKIEVKHEQMHQKHLNKLAKELGLTTEQKQEISGLMKDSWSKIKDEMNRVREFEKNVRKEADAKIEQILTPDQVTKFRQLREKMKKKIGNQMKKNCPAVK